VSEPNGAASAREHALAEIREAERFCLVTHEHPDGDALGSLVAMHRVLAKLGKDSVMLMAADEFPLPYEYRSFDLDGLASVAPDDVADRTIIFLDCGNIDRNPLSAVKGEDANILNIDHHHDNTRFGTVNLVDPEASCTAEIVWDLMRALDVEPEPEIADALYVGLVTDTGKFMYENTGSRAHQMAADLIAAGVDVHGIYRRLYEGMPYAKLELLARALQHVERHDDGALTLTRLTRDDFRLSGAEESYSEGIIDHLRSVEGTKVGHAGTLDPFATGLLLVLVGRATRAQRFLMGLPKAYETVARLGWTSTTGDPEGELVHTGRVPPDPPPLPTGELRQRPPAYSAVKIGGRRAYALARAGEAVDVPERTVHVERFEQLWRDGDRAGFAIECSSGTYVRSLIAGLGDAYCVELRRTGIGPFGVADAGDEPVPLARALAAVMATVALDDDAARRLGHGQRIELPSQTEGGATHVLAVDPAGEPVAIAEVEDGVARPRVGFRA
jgi:phosphoesterase RecJ-like protein